MKKLKFNESYSNLTEGNEYDVYHESESHYAILDDENSTAYLSKELNQYKYEVIEEWTPKQGEEVLVSDNRIRWDKRVFIIKHNGLFCVESSHCIDALVLYKFIKKYEVGLRVGDWLKCNLNNCVFKYELGRITDDLIKITDKELINKLEELCN